MTFHSRYTPSQMSSEALEELLVQREALASMLVEHIRVGVQSSSRHHDLLVGSRGTGKTHLISLVCARALADPELRNQLVIAWLPEDPWGVASYATLLRGMLQHLHPQPDAGVVEACAHLRGPDHALIERKAEDLLVRVADGRLLLLIVENLADVLDAIGPQGQRKLRAFIQERLPMAVLASACALHESTTRQAHPFFGFFATHHLDELSLDESVELLSRIAGRDDHAELKQYLQSAAGRARVRALRHLAGGNHRIHVVFASFLSAEQPSDVIEPLLRTLDDLTPYYRSRLQVLSPQQRQIVHVLSEHRGALPVSAIADRCLATPQTISKQLTHLNAAALVRSESLGRETYYELREPLLRLCFEVKQSRAEPLRVLVDLLCAWFSREELQLGAETETVAEPHVRYRTTAASLLRDGFSPRREWLADDVRRAVQSGRSEEADLAIKDLVAACSHDELPELSDQHVAVGLVIGQQPHLAVPIARNLLRLHPDDGFAAGLYAVSCLLSGTESSEALAAARRATAAEPDFQLHWQARSDLAQLEGELAESLISAERAVALDSASPAASQRWRFLAGLGKLEESIACFPAAGDREMLADMQTWKRDIDQRISSARALTERPGTIALLLEPLADEVAADAIPVTVAGLMRGVLGLAVERGRLNETARFVLEPLCGAAASVGASPALASWIGVFEDMGRDEPAIVEAVRLAKAARRFLRDGDRRHLMALAQEERTLVEDILRSPAPARPAPEAPSSATPKRRRKASSSKSRRQGR